MNDLIKRAQRWGAKHDPECVTDAGQLIDELIAALSTQQAQVKELEEYLETIAFGHTDNLAADPSKWSSHIAMKALGWTFENGKAYPPAALKDVNDE